MIMAIHMYLQKYTIHSIYDNIYRYLLRSTISFKYTTVSGAVNKINTPVVNRLYGV